MNRLWWLGLYEAVQPPILPWLFSRDYSNAIAVGVLKGVAGGKCSTKPADLNSSLLMSPSALISFLLSLGWGIVIFWLGFGTGMGEELHTGVEPVTVGNIFLFMLWAASMLFYTAIMASVSRINLVPTFENLCDAMLHDWTVYVGSIKLRIHEEAACWYVGYHTHD
jgi:hypothetical protein